MTLETSEKQVISTKEEIDGLKIITDRVKKRKAACDNAPREILFGRARSLTAAWKETEADPNRLRWAKAFARVMEDSAIVIHDGELIVGSETKAIRGAEIVPECNPYDVLAQMETRTHRTMSEVMMANIDPDTEGIKEVANFWVGRSINDIVYQAWQQKMGDSYTELIDGRRGKVAVTPDVNGTVYKTQTIFSPKIMYEGLANRIRKIQEEKEKTLRC